MKLFEQSSFLGGLNAQFDSSKSPSNSYPFGANVRVRNNNLVPIRRHKNLDGAAGNYQGLFAMGSVLVNFISGSPWYFDTAVNGAFRIVPLWVPMDDTARIYAQLVPRTSSFMNRLMVDNPFIVKPAFNGTIAAYPQALFVQNGVEQGRALFPGFGSAPLGTYSGWTIDAPSYVPIGKQMAFIGAKLFLVDPTGLQIFQSVSGRPSDFVVNIDVNGQKGGTADTVSANVSFDPTTGLLPLDNGNVMVSTLNGNFQLILDFDRPQFGEPGLLPQPLFPVGTVNERSYARILGSTAMISQNGIQSFNAVQQDQSESNSSPLGAKIRGLLQNPQSDTAATNFDLYALFAVNTVHGRGVFVYDETIDAFASFDDSFGHATQFAVTKSAGAERLFFITDDNAVYEAFAGNDTATAKVYLGDFVSGDTSTLLLAESVNLTFTDVFTSGHVKVRVFVDGEQKWEGVQELNASASLSGTDVSIPYDSRRTTVPVNFAFNPLLKGTKIGLFIEWTANAALCACGIFGNKETSANPPLIPVTLETPQKFVIWGGTGYGADLGPTEGLIATTEAHWYIFDPKDSGAILVQGAKTLRKLGLFLATAERCYVQGNGFSLYDCTDLRSLWMAATREGATIIGAGNHTPTGAESELAAFLFFLDGIYTLAGEQDVTTNDGEFFYGSQRRPRHYVQEFTNAAFFFYNGLDIEPDGNDVDSIQARQLKTNLAQNSKRFKFVIDNRAPYSADADNTPGNVDQRFPFRSWGAHAVISGSDRLYERFIVDAEPYFVIGLGGAGTSTLVADPNLKSSYNAGAAYILLEIDSVEARFTAKTVDGTVLDRYTVTA